MKALKKPIRALRLKMLQREYREGAMVSRFIAKDVKREILVISASRLVEGIIVGCSRTTNLLYLRGGLTEEKPFGIPEEIKISEAWKWTGQCWGGLPDGTSLVAPASHKKHSE